MKKRTYKRMQNRLLRETKARMLLEIEIEKATDRAKKAEEEAEYYKSRFRAFGSNVESIDPKGWSPVELLKWELKPEIWGKYIRFDGEIVEKSDEGKIRDLLEKETLQGIAKGLIERNIVQFIVREPDAFDPLNRYGTFAGKLYVVPWEQMPHERTIELRQYAERMGIWE